jgi:hypothetical protein
MSFSHHRSSQITGIPCAMVLTVYSALSLVIGFLATIPAQCEALSRVDASIGAPGPHGFTVRFTRARLYAREAATASRAPRP